MTLASLALRNVLRNRFRSALTVLGVAVAVLTFVMLRTFVYAWSMGPEFAAKDRVVTRNKVTFVMPLPLRYAEIVRQTPGVKAVCFSNWFGGRDPRNEHEFFATLASSKTFFDVYDEMRVPAEQMARWNADRSGAIVGDMLAKKLGWKVGEKLTLESGIYAGDPDHPWTFTIDGIYEATAKSVDRSTLVFHWDYLNDTLPEGRRDEIGWITSRVNDPSHAAEVGVQIDRVFDVRETQTLSQDERSFNASFLGAVSAILSAVDVVSVVILLIMMLVLGNTIAMGVRERTQEYGVLRALGFLPKHLAGFVLGEAAVTAGLGGLFGVALSYPVVERGIGRWLEENVGSLIPYFRIERSIMVVAVLLSVLLGLIAAALPAYQASKLRVTDALRRVA